MKNELFCYVFCFIVCSLGCIGDSWSIMILCDVFVGFICFDEFQKSSNVVFNILLCCLKVLVDDGLLEKVCYSSMLLCYEYYFILWGCDFCMVLLVLVEWGNCYFVFEGCQMQLVEIVIQCWVDLIMVDKVIGEEIILGKYVMVLGFVVLLLM